MVWTGLGVSKLSIQKGNRWEVKRGSGKDLKKSFSKAATAIIGASSRQLGSPVDSICSRNSRTIRTFADLRKIPCMNGPFANNCWSITRTGLGRPLSSSRDRFTPKRLGFSDSERRNRPVIFDRLFFFAGVFITGLRMKWHRSTPLLLICTRSKPSSVDSMCRKRDIFTANGRSCPINGYGVSSGNVRAQSWKGPWRSHSGIAMFTQVCAVISEPTMIVLNCKVRNSTYVFFPRWVLQRDE